MYKKEIEGYMEAHRQEMIDDICTLCRINSEKMPYSERLPLILACYNGGYGHITDARNLASYYGEDCNSWEVVSEYLELLAEEDFYNHEVVCYGEFSGSVETISYVDKVIRLYDDYCEKFPEKGDDKRG